MGCNSDCNFITVYYAYMLDMNIYIEYEFNDIKTCENAQALSEAVLQFFHFT